MAKKQRNDLDPPPSLATAVGPTPEPMDVGLVEQKEAAPPEPKGADLYPPGYDRATTAPPPPDIDDPQADAERERFGRELQEVERKVLKVNSPQDLARVAPRQLWQVAVRHSRCMVKRLIVQAETVEEAWEKFVAAKDQTPNEVELGHWKDWAHRHNARTCIPPDVEIMIAQAVTYRKELLRVKAG